MGLCVVVAGTWLGRAVELRGCAVVSWACTVVATVVRCWDALVDADADAAGVVFLTVVDAAVVVFLTVVDAAAVVVAFVVANFAVVRGMLGP